MQSYTNSQVGEIKLNIKKYDRITKEKSSLLIKLVFIESWKIKKAAKTLKIKYPTAKNIIVRYRKSKILRNPCLEIDNQRCSFKPITKTSNQVQVRIQRGGQLVESNCSSL